MIRTLSLLHNMSIFAKWNFYLFEMFYVIYYFKNRFWTNLRQTSIRSVQKVARSIYFQSVSSVIGSIYTGDKTSVWTSIEIELSFVHVGFKTKYFQIMYNSAMFGNHRPGSLIPRVYKAQTCRGYSPISISSLLPHKRHLMKKRCQRVSENWIREYWSSWAQIELQKWLSVIVTICIVAHDESM